MRGVKYVTYAFILILGIAMVVTFSLSRYQTSNARRHADTFIRILGALSLLLTYVFYYNLIGSNDEDRVRAEEQEANREVDMRSKGTIELTALYKITPNTVMSIVDPCPSHKYTFAEKAIDSGEMKYEMVEFRLNSIIFDLWMIQIPIFIHRSPSMVSQVGTMLTQAMSPIVRVSWKKYAYQYPMTMRKFVTAMYEVLDSTVDRHMDTTPNYEMLSLRVLHNVGYVDVRWNITRPFYTFRNVEYTRDKVKYYF